MALNLKSSAFTSGGNIPSKYTGDGDDIAPSLEWSNVPEKTRSLALIVDDPDAPDPAAPRMTWVHWVLFNIPSNTTRLPEGVKSRDLPAGTEEGLNDWKQTGYRGPNPPIGRHRYFFKLYALDTILTGMKRPTKAQVEAAMKSHIVASTELVGTYAKTR